MSKQQDQYFFTVKGDAIFVKLYVILWFFLVCSITDYGECLCVSKLSPVSLMHQGFYTGVFLFPI